MKFVDSISFMNLEDSLEKLIQPLVIFKTKKDFLNATSDKKLVEVLKKYNIKVRDRCHITGKYMNVT